MFCLFIKKLTVLCSDHKAWKTNKQIFLNENVLWYIMNEQHAKVSKYEYDKIGPTGLDNEFKLKLVICYNGYTTTSSLNRLTGIF